MPSRQVLPARRLLPPSLHRESYLLRKLGMLLPPQTRVFRCLFFSTVRGREPTRRPSVDDGWASCSGFNLVTLTTSLTSRHLYGYLSYRCFREFVDRFAPHIFETAPEEEAAAAEGGRRTFVVLEAHLVLLEQLLWFHDPTLAAHLDKCCVSPAAYATPWWVVCVFVSSALRERC